MFSHINSKGQPKMVDVSPKSSSWREAIAKAEIEIPLQLSDELLRQENKKGAPLEVAKLAGIMAAKKTSELIPLCHNLALDVIDLSITIDLKISKLFFESYVKTYSKTGVEMEALVAVSIAALTFYDMVKSGYPELIIKQCGVYQKSGGKTNYINSKLS